MIVSAKDLTGALKERRDAAVKVLARDVLSDPRSSEELRLRVKKLKASITR